MVTLKYYTTRVEVTSKHLNAAFCLRGESMNYCQMTTEFFILRGWVSKIARGVKVSKSMKEGAIQAPHD